MFHHGYVPIHTLGSTTGLHGLSFGKLRIMLPGMKSKFPVTKAKKCFVIVSMWFALFTAVLMPLFVSLNGSSASSLGSGILFVFPGDNHLVGVAPGYLCSGVEVTSVEGCSSTSGDVKVDLFLLDNGQPTCNNSFDFIMNHIVSLNGGSPNSSLVDDWYYLVYDLNHQTNVAVSACVVDGARQAYFYVIQGKNNLSQWERNTSGAYWVQQGQVDSDCLNSSIYQVSQDSTYYFVFFAKEYVVIKANLTFEFVSYLVPGNSSFCSIAQESDTCTCNMSVGSSGQYLLNTSISSVEPDSESIVCIKWNCDGYAVTLILLMIMPIVLLFLVYSVFIFFARSARVLMVASYGGITFGLIVLAAAVLALEIGLPLVSIQTSHSAQFTPGDTRLVSFSSVICSGISISSVPPTVDATVYIVDEQPPLNGTNEFQVNMTKYFGPSQNGYYYTLLYYLHEESLFSMPSACHVAGDELVNFYIIKGEEDYLDWWSDTVKFEKKFFRSVVIKKGPCLQNPIPELKIITGDSYYFILFSASPGDIPAKNTGASIVMNFNRTEYVVASGTSYPNCTINGHKLGQFCMANTRGARLGTKALITLSASPESDYNLLTEISWVCLPSVAAWTGISLAVVTGNGLILALLIGSFCLLIRCVKKYKKRHNTPLLNPEVNRAGGTGTSTQ